MPAEFEDIKVII